MDDYVKLSDGALVDARNLKKGDIQKRHIHTNAIEVLKKINEELQTAHSHGHHYLETDIPIIYDIPNMGIADGQRAVWTLIIQTLTKKNYRVWINYTKDNCKLRITWMSEDDELQIKHQKEVLKKHRKEF